MLCTCTVVLFLIQNSAFKKILEEIITSTSIIVNIMVRAVKKVQPENLNDSRPKVLCIMTQFFLRKQPSVQLLS